MIAMLWAQRIMNDKKKFKDVDNSDLLALPKV